MGCNNGWLSISDLQNHQTIKNIKVLSGDIYSMAFSRDNQTAYISDYDGNIKIINWCLGADSEHDFDFNEQPKKVGYGETRSICLTKDEKYLLVGSKGLVAVFETTTKEVKVWKEIVLTVNVHGINLIKDGKFALVAEYNGDLSIIDLESWDIFKRVFKNVTTEDWNLESIIVI